MWKWVIGVSKSTSAEVGISLPLHPRSSHTDCESWPPKRSPVSGNLRLGRFGRSRWFTGSALNRAWGEILFLSSRAYRAYHSVFFYFSLWCRHPPPSLRLPPSDNSGLWNPRPATTAGLFWDQLTWCCSYVWISCKIPKLTGRERRVKISLESELFV